MEQDTVFEAPAPLLPEILSLHGKWLGSKPAVICGRETLTWTAFDQRLNQVANGLIAQGIQRGDSVAIVMQNGLPMIEAIFGVVKAGAAAVPLNLSVSDAAIKAMTVDSGARAVIATPSEAARIDDLRAELTAVPPNGFIAVDRPSAGWTDYQDWRRSQPVTDPQRPISGEDVCNIIYSSGTTGMPKGIVHDHRRRLDWAYDLGLALRYHSGAVALCSIGLYSNISWACMLSTLLVGGTVVILPAFSPLSFLDAVETYHVTHTAMVPLQFAKVLDEPGFAERDKTSLQTVMSCGSPLREGLKKRILAELGCDLIELYGLTEGLITTLAPEDVADKLASVGKPLPGEDIRILDDHNRDVQAGQVGEIVGRGRIIMAGYHNRPEATRETQWTDATGQVWLRTGDLGYVDKDGFLYIVDRKKDMILSGGQNIYPADLEAVVAQHPAVADAAVIGVPHQKWGETPLALVCIKQGHSTLPDELMRWTNERVGRQQRLSGVELRKILPRNANGKLLKRELREPYWTNTESRK